jgi:hypothetical protein
MYSGNNPIDWWQNYGKARKSQPKRSTKSCNRAWVHARSLPLIFAPMELLRVDVECFRQTDCAQAARNLCSDTANTSAHRGDYRNPKPYDGSRQNNPVHGYGTRFIGYEILHFCNKCHFNSPDLNVFYSAAQSNTGGLLYSPLGYHGYNQRILSRMGQQSFLFWFL